MRLDGKRKRWAEFKARVKRTRKTPNLLGGDIRGTAAQEILDKIMPLLSSGKGWLAAVGVGVAILLFILKLRG